VSKRFEFIIVTAQELSLHTYACWENTWEDKFFYNIVCVYRDSSYGL